MTAVTYVTFRLLTRQYTKNQELCSLRSGDERWLGIKLERGA